eukprot:CAMPEP_0197893014 /NCGR_PEP_ID=MMETSP1439-20131203/32341_1 /TAXON_ID=66791 /ORGANISM="Gonyaulax spinifera, Strain CCMP409" /LENGTH=79 /DNA_ID=CAMNT_0043513249 /DNA_START=17 /DNA_END=253 /DNA_ORIENTATION=-
MWMQDSASEWGKWSFRIISLLYRIKQALTMMYRRQRQNFLKYTMTNWRPLGCAASACVAMAVSMFAHRVEQVMGNVTIL